MNQANLQCEMEGLSQQEHTMRIALVVLAVISITIIVTASAFNAIATSETEPQRNDLSHGSVAKIHNGIVHVAMPKGKKAFPVELVPVP